MRKQKKILSKAKIKKEKMRQSKKKFIMKKIMTIKKRKCMN